MGLIFNNSLIRLNVGPGSGNGIFGRGATYLTDTVVANNSSAPFANSKGGAIYTVADLTITRCAIAANTSGNQTGGTTSDGGAIGVGGGTTSIVDSTISENHAFQDGGAISIESGTVTITNSLIAANTAGRSGGAINSVGVLNLIHTTIYQNTAPGGGGITAGNTLNVTDSWILDNEATDTANSGGGGLIINGRATIINTDIKENSGGHGGGILSQNGIQNLPVTITNSRLIRNTAAFGGALYIDRGPVNVADCTFVNNAAFEGGGIYNINPSNTLTIDRSFIDFNLGVRDGGGLYVRGGTVINNSTISANGTDEFSAGTGGGGMFVASGAVTMTNSTITGNSSDEKRGGGIFNGSTVNLLNVTIHGNAAENGGGIYSTAGNQVTARNTLIGVNIDDGGTPDCFGSLVSQGYNLIQNTGGTVITGVTTGNILGRDPQLVGSGFYGGPTITVGLQATSPAIDAADPANVLAIDQRGIPRPQDGDLNGTNLPDIGAYERQVVTLTVTKIADTGDGVCNGDCSLREALSAASANPDIIIVFDLSTFSTPQTIVLTGGELVLPSSGTLIIQGGGPNLLTIDGNQQSRVFTNKGFAVLRGLTITGGNGVGELESGNYGGIYNGATLNLDNTEIRNNSAAGNGGGIGNVVAGMLTIVRSTIRSNSAGLAGGGIYGFANWLAISDSTIDHNSAGTAGGGIQNARGAIERRWA